MNPGTARAETSVGKGNESVLAGNGKTCTELFGSWIDVWRQERHENQTVGNGTVSSPSDIALPGNLGMKLSFIEPIEHNGECIQ